MGVCCGLDGLMEDMGESESNTQSNIPRPGTENRLCASPSASRWQRREADRV